MIEGWASPRVGWRRRRRWRLEGADWGWGWGWGWGWCLGWSSSMGLAWGRLNISLVLVELLSHRGCRGGCSDPKTCTRLTDGEGAALWGHNWCLEYLLCSRGGSLCGCRAVIGLSVCPCFELLGPRCWRWAVPHLWRREEGEAGLRSSRGWSHHLWGWRRILAG